MDGSARLFELDPAHELLRRVELRLDRRVRGLERKDLFQVRDRELWLERLQVACCAPGRAQYDIALSTARARTGSTPSRISGRARSPWLHARVGRVSPGERKAAGTHWRPRAHSRAPRASCARMRGCTRASRRAGSVPEPAHAVESISRARSTQSTAIAPSCTDPRRC
jgi:hypothetical protein